MSDLLLQIYRFFNARKIVFYLVLTIFSSSIALIASQIKFEEDITRSIAIQDHADNLPYVVSHLKLSDKIIVDISLADILANPAPEELESLGGMFVDSLNKLLDTTYIRSITFRASDTLVTSLMGKVTDHLPTFLEETDYKQIDSLVLPGSIAAAFEKNYKILVSPAGMLMKNKIQQDPLGISNIALARLKSLQAGDNFEIHHGCVFTSDLRHLLIFIVPANPASETSLNDALIKGLDDIIRTLAVEQGNRMKIQYFGGTAVAVSNARQLKKDITLTLIIAISLIFLLIGWYFKSLRIPLLGLLPALFGGGLALALLFLAKGSISAISLGIGSVILGLIVDYTLYFVNQYRRTHDIGQTLRDMWLTIVLCSVTSAGAFLCLTFLSSSVLQDLGWFAACSVAGAAFFTLFILPQLMDEKLFIRGETRRSNFIDKLAVIRFDRNKWFITGLLCILLTSTFFTGRVEFEKDMSALSFVTPELAQAEAGLDRISNYKLKNLFLVATAKTTEEALKSKEKLNEQIHRLVKEGVIQGVSDAGSLLSSDSMQRSRIIGWNNYWTTEKKQQLKTAFLSQSEKYGFNPSAFDAFFELIGRNYKPLTVSELNLTSNPVISEWLSVNPELVLAPTLLKVAAKNKNKVYQAFPGDKTYVLFDRENLTRRFIENVRHDFDLLVMLSMIFVTLLLVFSFGRLGLGLMAAMPVFFSWIITLGFMGITGIRFNIFNIIISSFIFGLGVDYSILMMRGLQHTLITGKDELQTYKVSVLLSSLTTLFGVGVLFFTRHPALNSIAMVSVVGILAVVILTFVFQPFIFHAVILSRQRRHQFPVTFRILIKTLVTWGNIVFIAILLMIAGSIINLLLPVRRKKKELLFHYLFYWLTKAYIAVTFAWDRKLSNEPGEDFTRPAIIISNHQSLIETPAFLRLYPKIIILTTSWVYRSPIFGPIARLANFYNVDHGIDSIIGLLKEKVDEGFSILIFPEAHRSDDHQIQRFHKGAFYLAEKLEIDILPILVFGTGDFLGKGAFWGRPNSFRMKILNRVTCDDPSFGKDYQQRTKLFRKFYIAQYAQYKAEEGNAHYYRRKLALNYVLKGPVLEWYMRVKLRLENNYDLYDQLMPKEGNILDLGCGYGFISYMLMFTGDNRHIMGVDYDAGKIEVASNCFSRNNRIDFICADVIDYEITPKNGFLLSDVLHYLTPNNQVILLEKCFINLQPGGIILIREANGDLALRHKKSRMTEFLSTRTGFNKTPTADKELYFTSASQIRELAAKFGLSLEVIDNKKLTSNNLFILRHSAAGEM